ncbi:MAG: xanthine dehydrogenase family protein molybdopterin-binding subunit, partial [Planctomycetaceae bacterium]
MSTAENPKYKVIGTRPIRHDGIDKVTGRAKYGGDVQMAGLLHGAVLRSPHAHARIVSIDTSAAEAHPGVQAVVTNADLPEIGSKIADLGEGMFDLKDLNRNVLARDKALYRGHAVAAVAAENVHVAHEAVKLIKVEYEILPPVLDVREAMQPDAAILHEHLRTKEMGVSKAAASDRPTNIAKHFLHEKGDITKGFQEAEQGGGIVIEREFTTATVHQG